MEQILDRGFALCAAAALVGAGLIATTPTTPPMPLPAPAVQHIDIQLTTDVFSALATNVDNIFTDTWSALTSLTELHLSTAATDLVSSWFNILYIPENLITGGLAFLTGDSSPIFLETQLITFTSNLSQVWNGLTEFSGNIASALQNLFSLHLADAYTYATIAFDGVILGIPAELIIGPLMALGL